MPNDQYTDAGLPILTPKAESTTDSGLPVFKKKDSTTSNSSSTPSTQTSNSVGSSLNQPSGEGDLLGKLTPKVPEKVPVPLSTPVGNPPNAHPSHVAGGYSWDRPIEVVGHVEGDNKPAPVDLEKLLPEGQKILENIPNSALLANPLLLGAKMGLESGISSVQGLIQGGEEESKAIEHLQNPETMQSNWQYLELPAALVKMGFSAASLMSPQLAAFNVGVQQAEKVLPSDLVPTIMSPFSTLLEKSGGHIPIMIGGQVRVFNINNPDKLKAAAELTDLVYNILLFKGSEALAGKVIHNEALSPLEQKQVNDAVDGAFKEDVTPVNGEIFNTIPKELPDATKLKAYPVLEQKDAIKKENDNLNQQKQQVIQEATNQDEAFKPVTDEKVKVIDNKISENQTKIEDANQEIKFILDSSQKTEPIELPLEPENKGEAVDLNSVSKALQQERKISDEQVNRANDILNNTATQPTHIGGMVKSALDKYEFIPIGLDKHWSGDTGEYAYIPKPNENTVIVKEGKRISAYDKTLVNENGELIDDSYTILDNEGLKKFGLDSRKPDDEFIYRGVSKAELDDIIANKRIKSNAKMNLGEQQQDITSFADNPNMALNYAHGFEAWNDKVTFDEPKYLIKVKRGEDTIKRQKDGELDIQNDIPIDRVSDIYEIRLAKATDGRIGLFNEEIEGKVKEGSRSPMNTEVVIKRQPNALQNKKNVRPTTDKTQPTPKPEPQLPIESDNKVELPLENSGENKVEGGDKSLHDKVGEMNSLGTRLANAIDDGKIDASKLSESESDVLYGVADGLSEDFVMKHIEGRASLGALERNTPEKLEKYVDEKIAILKAIEEKHLPPNENQKITTKDEDVVKIGNQKPKNVEGNKGNVEKVSGGVGEGGKLPSMENKGGEYKVLGEKAIEVTEPIRVNEGSRKELADFGKFIRSKKYGSHHLVGKKGAIDLNTKDGGRVSIPIVIDKTAPNITMEQIGKRMGDALKLHDEFSKEKEANKLYEESKGWQLTQSEYLKKEFGINKENYVSDEHAKYILKEDYYDEVKANVENGNMSRAVKDGDITAKKAIEIIDSAKSEDTPDKIIEVPKEILDKAKSETLPTNEIPQAIEEAKTEVTPKAEIGQEQGTAPSEQKVEETPKSKLQLAKEDRIAAKAKLEATRNKTGIIDNPEERAKALYDYHKALVKEGKEYFNEGVKTVKEFAEKIGEKVDDVIKRAWDEITGNIPEQKVEDFLEKPITEGEKELKLEADDKSLLNRLVASDNVSDTAKQIFEKEGLKYKVHNQEEARDLAGSIVKEFGAEESVRYAEANRFGGDINSAIFGEAIDSTARREEAATDTKVKTRWARKWADYAIRYDEWLRQAGRAISQAYNFYKNSELGLKFAVEKSNEKYIREQLKPIEENLKTAFEDFKKQFAEQYKESPEFKEAVKTEAEKITAKERAKKTADKIRSAKLDDDIMLSSIPFAKQVINGAIEAVAQIVEAGGTIEDAIREGIKYMKSTKWYEDLSESDRPQADSKLQTYLEKTTAESKPKTLKETDREKILAKWKTKLNKLTEKQRTRLLKRAGLEMIENGALDYEDFRKMYAEEAGLDVLTPEAQAKLTDIVKTIKAVEDAIKTFDESTLENFAQAKKDLFAAQEKARRAAKAYSDFFRKDKSLGDQFTSYMRLNSLPIISLMTNLGQYPFYQPLRFIESAIGTPLDFALTKMAELGNNIFEKTGLDYRLPTERTTNIAGRQMGAWSGFKLGVREAIQDLRRGVTDRDYFRKEINESIKPARAWAEMIDAAKGERKLSVRRWASNALEGTSGAFAEGAVRFMNLFDKPLRYMAEQAKAEEIGRRIGLTGIELQKFIIHPSEKYQEILRSEGERAVFQQSSTVQKVINSAKKTLEEETGEKSKYVNFVSKAIFYANQPFLNTPINMFNTAFDYAMPEISFLKGIHAIASGDKARGTLLLQRAIVGKSLSLFATTLAINGIVTPSNDDTTKEREYKDTSIKSGRFNMSAFNRFMSGGDPTARETDSTFDLTRLGIFGTLLLIHADKVKDKTNEQWKEMSYLDKSLATLKPTVGEGLQNGVFRGTSAIATAIQTGNMNQILPNMANIYLNAIYPATARDIVRSGQDYLYRTKADTWSESVLNEAKKRFGIVKELPRAVNVWGDVIPATPKDRNAILYYLFDVTKEQKLDQPQFGWDISDLYIKHRGDEQYLNKIMPSNVEYNFKYNGKEYNLKGKDQEALDIAVGHARKLLAQSLITYNGSRGIKDRNGKQTTLSWGAMNDDEKATALKEIYEEGYEQGKEKYLSTIGVPIIQSKKTNTPAGQLPPNQ